MNAAVVHAYNVPPTYETFADPVPQPGEQLVRVTAAALHQIVRGLASGTHYGATGDLPIIPGVDGVGILQSPLGDIPAGTHVYFGLSRAPYGTFAELGLASATVFTPIPIPAGLSDATAAAIANPAMSSWVALTARAHFQPGQSVLIQGATGVAGQLAVQIAKRRGAARVIATGRNPEALARLATLGADATISLDQTPEALLEAFRAEFATAAPDIILDYLWGQPAETLLAALSKKGLKTSSNPIRYVNIGSMAGPNISLPAATLRSTGLELVGSGFGSASLDQIRQAVTEFFSLAATEPFNFSLREAPLSQVESLWNTKEEATRLVFLP